MIHSSHVLFLSVSPQQRGISKTNISDSSHSVTSPPLAAVCLMEADKSRGYLEKLKNKKQDLKTIN